MSKTPQEPKTEAGRRHLQWLLAGDDVFPEDALADIRAIEAEAVEPWREALTNVVNFHDDYSLGCHPCMEARALEDSER